MDRSIALLNISAVERETGLSKDVLRVWGAATAFPSPDATITPERRYSPEQVAKLRVIKRLMDTGCGPAKLMHQPLAELNVLADIPRRAAPGNAHAPVLERDVLALVRNHNAPALQHAFAHLLMRQGLQRFVLETVTALNRAVGEAWMRGELQVFEEHLYTELLQAALRSSDQCISAAVGCADGSAHHFSGEQHGLGLLMVEALLVPGRRAVHFAGNANAAR